MRPRRSRGTALVPAPADRQAASDSVDRKASSAPAGRQDSAAAADRGQINVDFVLGIVLFLVAFTFVVGFLPQLLAPYDDQSTPLVAERAEGALVDSLLRSSAGPGILDVPCTGAFFVDADDSTCPFDASDSVQDQLGIPSSSQVNVTVRANVTGDARREVLCYNGGDVGACGSGRLAVGSSVPRGDRAVAAERVAVGVGDHAAVLEVAVW